jgi:hypothetical protein
MVLTARMVCLLLAILCFAVAALGWAPPRGSLLAAGLGLVALALLL